MTSNRRHASQWIPQWRGTPAAAVTVRDLLSNDSGRRWSPGSTTRSSAGRDRTGSPSTQAGGTTGDGVGVQQLGRPDPAAGLRSARPGQDVAAFAQATVRAARDHRHHDDHRRGGQRADVRGGAVDVSRHGAVRPGDARPGALGRHSGSCRPRGSARRRAVVERTQRGLRVPVVAQPRGRAGRAPGPGSTCPRARRTQTTKRAPRARGARRDVLGVGLGNQIIQVDPCQHGPSSCASASRGPCRRRPPRPGRSQRGGHPCPHERASPAPRS